MPKLAPGVEAEKGIRLQRDRFGDHTLSENEGRVEVFHNGVWGTVCDQKWTSKDAFVACKQLGYKSGQPTWNAIKKKTTDVYGPGEGQIWLATLKCTGNEDFLADCPNEGWGVASCSHEEDAGVVCSN